MAWWLGLLAAAFAYLVWLSWFDTRHHRPIVAASAAFLAAAYLGTASVVVVEPLVALPLWPTILAFVLVEVAMRSLHRLRELGTEHPTFRPQYPLENP